MFEFYLYCAHPIHGDGIGHCSIKRPEAGIGMVYRNSAVLPDGYRVEQDKVIDPTGHVCEIVVEHHHGQTDDYSLVSHPDGYRKVTPLDMTTNFMDMYIPVDGLC